MSSAMISYHQPRTPQHAQTRWSDRSRTHGLTSPAVSVDSQLIPGQQKNLSPFLLFCSDWQELRKEHPTGALGLDILDDLAAVTVTPNVQYPAHRHLNPRGAVDLAQMTRIDIKAFHMDRSLILHDLRSERARHEQRLLDGDDLRQALYGGQPVIFRIQAQLKGLASVRLDVPHYVTERVGHTVVAGEGAFYTMPPAHNSDAILTQTIGKCLLVTFPQTPENAAVLTRGPSTSEQRRWLRWALRQPGVDVRILFPGESTFLSRESIRFVMSLGHDESRYSATAVLYVTHHRVVEHQKCLARDRDARPHKTRKPYDRPVSDMRQPSVNQPGVHSHSSRIPRDSSLPRGELVTAVRAGHATRVPRPPTGGDPGFQSTSDPRRPSANLPVAHRLPPRLSQAPVPSRGEPAPVVRAGSAARAPSPPATTNSSFSSDVLHPRQGTASATEHGHSHSSESSGGRASAQMLPANPRAVVEHPRSIWARVDTNGLEFSQY
ncbi:hypothetical protein AURDEDRAFT_129275 [Auricularia subglabra TFB-10046 SS5]|uniref:Uncharacterized protein n=1 Tax=Auricularia subglabra (strain TFB-10046 / SS5) TaxID=717982 RepID=J0WUQ7_AURST|nr:hypothetical protein AURDEDRAFT_129275 [Auricularia subglabra TFB-10046 SS5]